YKRITLIFSFSHHMSEANASYCGVKRNNASSEKAVYEALCVMHASGVSSTQKYEAILRIMKHACRRMKRSLFRLHVFLP
ncbi:MAG: hypothetical protein IKC82_00835, partial [Lentisphaeria bacterium]|nr:hypothetical protein [Lentisphaeria bacterium]